MVSKAESYAWVLVMAVLVALSIPWFMWGDGRLVAGLPLWLWWHVGWMALSAVAFWVFTRRAWGVGITDPAGGERP